MVLSIRSGVEVAFTVLWWMPNSVYDMAVLFVLM